MKQEMRLFELPITRSAIPKAIMARVKPTMAPGGTKPLIAFTDALFDLASKRIELRILSIRERHGNRSHPLCHEGGRVHRLIAALEQIGFHIGLTHTQAASILDLDLERTRDHAQYKATKRELRDIMLKVYGLLVVADWRGTLRLIQSNEMTYIGRMWANGARSYLETAQEVIWGRAPKAARILETQIPLWTLEEVTRANPKG